jgi:uncharacterized protein (TIGR00730 family)
MSTNHSETQQKIDQNADAHVSTEGTFLEGPRSRSREFWFTLKMLIEFIKGFRMFHFVGPCVTIFGSARTPKDDPYFDMARKMGAAVSKLGFTVMTGGGPGIMEAANMGAKEAGGRSVGINIKLPHEQYANPYLDKWMECRYFFTRKVLMFKYSYAFIIMPGGMGTLDELFEAATLIQTGKINDFPIILMGREYWEPIIQMLNRMKERGTVSPGDLDLIYITDSIKEAIQILDEHAVVKYKLRKEKNLEPVSMIGE